MPASLPPTDHSLQGESLSLPRSRLLLTLPSPGIRPEVHYTRDQGRRRAAADLCMSHAPLVTPLRLTLPRLRRSMSNTLSTRSGPPSIGQASLLSLSSSLGSGTRRRHSQFSSSTHLYITCARVQRASYPFIRSSRSPLSILSASLGPRSRSFNSHTHHQTRVLRDGSCVFRQRLAVPSALRAAAHTKQLRIAGP